MCTAALRESQAHALPDDCLSGRVPGASLGRSGRPGSCCSGIRFAAQRPPERKLLVPEGGEEGFEAEDRDLGLSQKSESQNPENEVKEVRIYELKETLTGVFLLVSIISLMCRVEEHYSSENAPENVISVQN